MKYYSELLSRTFDTVEELERAEAKKNAEIEKAKAEKVAEENKLKALEKELEAAKNAYIDALKNYEAKLGECIKLYGKSDADFCDVFSELILDLLK